jgi:hypothetical protein
MHDMFLSGCALLCLQALDIQGAVPTGSHPRQLAGQLLALMGAFTRDIATVHNILDSFYEYLDERHRWQERGIVQVRGGLGLACRGKF